MNKQKILKRECRVSKKDALKAFTAGRTIFVRPEGLQSRTYTPNAFTRGKALPTTAQFEREVNALAAVTVPFLAEKLEFFTA